MNINLLNGPQLAQACGHDAQTTRRRLKGDVRVTAMVLEDYAHILLGKHAKQGPLWDLLVSFAAMERARELREA